jgi:NAD(P)-dependent dehydrogenase (short-subunit alcohol dehydrogenase family)
MAGADRKSFRGTALVTGAAGAVGRCTVVELALAGYRVAACDLASAQWSALETGIQEAGLGDLVRRFDLDVTSDDDIVRTVGAVVEWSDETLEVVVNNAGVRSGGLFTHTPLAAHRAMFDVNYFGVCGVTRAALPHLRPRGRGHVVVVSSIGAIAGLPGLSGYCASKSAVEGWAESAAMELRPFGVRFTLVEPASIKSNIWRSGEFHVDETAADVELGRRLSELDRSAESNAGDPASVASAIVRSIRLGRWWTPSRIPVGRTAVARLAARGVVPSGVQQKVLRRMLALPAPARSSRLEPGAVVVVTGASSGLGRSLVMHLHDRGCHVVGTVRDTGKAEKLRSDLDGRAVDLVEMDQTDERSVRAAFARVAETHHGRLDAVVANAGLKVTGPFEALTDESLRRMIEVNVFGTWSVVRESVPLLLRSGGGRVVVVGSSSGFTGMPGWSGYAASKFALERWVESVAYELRPAGIDVAIVEPGTFRSEIYRDGSSVEVHDGPYEALARAISMREVRSLENAPGPEPVVDRIASVLSAEHPPLRAPVGIGARLRHAAHGVVPGAVLQRAFMVR